MNTRVNANGNGQGGQPRLAPEPWSLDDAIAAAVAEATETPFVFERKGKTYTLPPIKDLPFGVQGMLAAGDIEGILVEMLGQDDFDELTGDITIRGAEVLFNEWARLNGINESQGNSPRGSSSRRSLPRGSART